MDINTNKKSDRPHIKAPENNPIKQSFDSENKVRGVVGFSDPKAASMPFDKRSVEANAKLNKTKNQIDRQKLSPSMLEFLDPDDSNEDIHSLIKSKMSGLKLDLAKANFLLQLMLRLNTMDDTTLQDNIPVLDFVLSDRRFCEGIVRDGDKDKLCDLNMFSKNPILECCKNHFGIDFVNNLQQLRKEKLLGLKTGLDRAFFTDNDRRGSLIFVTFYDAIESLRLFKPDNKDASESIDSAMDCLERGFNLIANRAQFTTSESLLFFRKHEFKKALEYRYPILIDAPYNENHNVNTLIKDGYLAVCNRGDNVRRWGSGPLKKPYMGIELFKFDPKKATDELVQAILKGDIKEIEKHLQSERIGYYQASPQRDSNCSYASLKMGVLASFMIDELERKNTSISHDKPLVLNEVCLEAVKLYKDWSLDLRVNQVKTHPEKDIKLAYAQLKTANRFIQQKGPLAFMQAVKSGELWDKKAYQNYLGQFEENRNKKAVPSNYKKILSLSNTDPNAFYSHLLQEVLLPALENKDKATFSSGLSELETVLSNPQLSEKVKDHFNRNSVLRDLRRRSFSEAILSKEDLEIALKIDPSE